jgi:hypothetical protein
MLARANPRSAAATNAAELVFHHPPKPFTLRELRWLRTPSSPQRGGVCSTRSIRTDPTIHAYFA